MLEATSIDPPATSPIPPTAPPTSEAPYYHICHGVSCHDTFVQDITIRTMLYFGR
ncbi:hypothetical protein CK203_116464 [Vitis vinifera]|uniref:Uncharacterized protein n=1 Tax=Vitis vinifera TaxID=29760 RepID=A0A438CUL1_VITVI|nr:hypothetical protein CK203_116464 [Vitis vinifera]